MQELEDKLENAKQKEEFYSAQIRTLEDEKATLNEELRLLRAELSALRTEFKMREDEFDDEVERLKSEREKLQCDLQAALLQEKELLQQIEEANARATWTKLTSLLFRLVALFVTIRFLQTLLKRH